MYASILPAVIDLYQKCEVNWEPLDHIFAEELRKYPLSGPGRGAVVQSLQGMIRHHGRLLGAMGRLLEPELADTEPSQRLRSLTPVVRVRLLAAAYIVAVEGRRCNEATAIAGIRDPHLVQALERLPEARRAAEAMVDAAARDIPPEATALLAEGLSLPRWLVSTWGRQRGWAETVRLGRALLEPPPLTLRVAPDRIDRVEALRRLKEESDLDARPTRLSPFGMILPRRVPLEQLALYRSGEVEAQDEGSQLVALAVGAGSEHRVLDMCAGAGGKILLIAALQRSDSAPPETYACDPSRNRLQEMKKRLARAGLTHVQVRHADALHPHALVDLRGRMDRILVDAPCSGLGALRRNPEARWRLQPADLERFPPLQLKLLEKAATLLRRGGRIVYATCTLNQAENQDVIDAAAALGMRPTPILPQLAAFGVKTELEDGPGGIELLPHRHGTDGFFIAALERV